MGLFLQFAILKGSTLSDFTQALSKVSEEHPEMNLEATSGSFHTYADGTGILFSDEVVGYEPLAKSLSEKLGRSVMLLYIYDGDQWGYYLYENGQRLDAFNPMPDYFTGNESETESMKGNAEIVARHFGVSSAYIDGYLVRWTQQRMEKSEKAYPSDQFAYGDCWQIADFMSALHHPYAFTAPEDPADAEDTPNAAAFDTALITNDLERWIADTYVLWSCHGGGNYQLFGGYPKNQENTDIFKEMMKRDWNITNLADGINMVNMLVADKQHQTPATDGWDFCRGMQLIGLFYLVGFIDRAQMVDYSCIIGKVMQRHFRSWEALCKSYLTGYTQWCSTSFGLAEGSKQSSKRRALYKKYKKMKDGPYRVPWNMPLTPVAAAKSAVTHSTTQNYFEQWLSQEEQWVAAYRRKASKSLLLVIMPSVLVFMSIFMAVLGFAGGARGSVLFAAMVPGVSVGLVVTLPVYAFVMHRLTKGRISNVIRKTVKMLEMNAGEQETLGMEMLAALQSNRGHMDYQDRVPRSQATPARLVVSKNYFYQTGTRMFVILVRRSDVDYIEAGQERKFQGISSRNAQTFILHAVYFYYRSTREQRLEGKKTADNGMGFFDPAIRDQAFAMINQYLRVQ